MTQVNSNSIDIQYYNLVKKILSKQDNGVTEDRTGAGRLRIFGHQMRFDLRQGFPILGLKKTHFASVVKELAWFLKGSTNIEDLGCSIWNEWANINPESQTVLGSIGPMYGEKWRKSLGVGPLGLSTREDQLANVIAEAIRNPYSSRLIVDCWDPHLIPRPELSVQENLSNGYMALAPCHFAFQFFCEKVNGKMYIDLKPFCRSQDVMLGTPFNISSYALLLKLVAKKTGYEYRDLLFDMGDTHIYGNHLDKMDEFLFNSEIFIRDRSDLILQGTWLEPELIIPEHVTLDNLHDHIDEVVNGLINYNPMPHIKFPRN